MLLQASYYKLAKMHFTFEIALLHSNSKLAQLSKNYRANTSLASRIVISKNLVQLKTLSRILAAYSIVVTSTSSELASNFDFDYITNHSNSFNYNLSYQFGDFGLKHN